MTNFKVKNGIEATTLLQSTATPSVSTITDSFSTATATSEVLDFSAQSTGVAGFKFKPDGTKVYIGSAGEIDQFDMSTAWDLTTASYTSTVTGIFSYFNGFNFKPDGTKAFLVRSAFGTDTINSFSFGTPWDISTLTDDTIAFSVGTELTDPRDVFFKPDGTKMFVYGLLSTTYYIVEYDLSTAWDITTASHTAGKTYAMSAGYSYGVNVNGDGTAIYVGNDGLKKITLSTAWDITTATEEDLGFPSSAIHYKDSSKFYVISTYDSITAYDLTADEIAFDISSGNSFQYTPVKNTIVTGFTNPPPAGKATAFSMSINSTNGYNITWPTSVKWHGRLAPTLSSGKDSLVFVTADSGTSYFAKKLGGDFQ